MDIKELQSLLSRYEAGEDGLFEVLEKGYSKLVEDDPVNVKYVHGYGYLFECKGRRCFNKAEEIYKKVLFKHKEDKNPYSFRIDAQLMKVRNALGKNKESIELYKQRVLDCPDDAEEYMFLARAYLYADQVQEAKKVMEAVERVASIGNHSTYTAVIYYYTMGDIYSRLGDNEKALDYWNKSVKDQFSMGGWYSRAFLLKDLGRLVEAADEWRKIIKMLEEHHDPITSVWPKEELAKLEAELNK